MVVVFDGYYIMLIGQACLVVEGDEVFIIIYGMGVYWVLEVCVEMGVDVDILDLCIFLFLDYDVIWVMVQKINWVLFLYEDI